MVTLQEMSLGLLRSVVLRAGAKRLPALPGSAGEADGGQSYQRPSRILVFRLETPRGTRTGNQLIWPT